MIIVNKLFVRIKSQILLKKISCLLLPGRITTFIGKSGAGKTTLLKSLIGLIPKIEGEIFINNKELNILTPSQRAEKIGYIFQDFNLFPHLTVLQNCVDPLLVYGISFTDAHKRALEQLKEFDMHEFIDKYPFELSGGQQQRVAIARGLCLNPQVLLLDEPTASLDPFNTDLLITILKRLSKQGLTIGLSTQDMHFANKLLDRIYYIENGEIIEFCDGKEKLAQCPVINQFMK
ncbi:MAG: ATP-binding cassette domain-containing protein [Candidatus Babeliales bacterium]